jgi:hypothetical protein
LEADRLGQDAVFDLLARDEAEQDDSTPGADTAEDGAPFEAPERRRLLALARDAEALRGAADPKLKTAERLVRELVADGFQPILFCRYVATAHYVRDELTRRLSGVRVDVVTGELPPEERADRVADLAREPKRVLVATDYLSEGVNLQQHFNAVVHYDLSWNPTRHEQREGRVDRYGQPVPTVRTALIYGQDNQVDGAVLKVLLRKAERIRRTLGVSVPVPVDTNAVLEAIFEALFLRQNVPAEQLSLFLDDEEERLNRAWDVATDRERRSRTVFAQHGLRPEEVFAELEAAHDAVGAGPDVERFVVEAATRLGAPPTRNGVWQLDPARLPRAVVGRAELAENGPLKVGFELPVPDDVLYLARTHPLVEALASFALDTALADPERAIARRCAAIRTPAVRQRTVLLVLRARFLIEESRGASAATGPPDAHAHSQIAESRGADWFPMLAEECFPAAFEGDPNAPTWLDTAAAERLAHAQPTANLVPGQAQHWLKQVLDAAPAWTPHLAQVARSRADELLEAHRRVRQAARQRGVRHRVQPHQDLDLLGLYVLMPGPQP